MTSRTVVALAVVSHVFGIACASEGERPDPVVANEDASIVERLPATSICRGSTGAARDVVLVTAGRPFSWRIRVASQTVSCQCEYVSTTQAGCAKSTDCDSTYELGGNDNPVRCTAVGLPHSVRVDAATHDADAASAGCDVETTIESSDEGIVDVKTTCTTAGRRAVHIRLVTSEGERSEVASVTVTSDGACPEEP